MSNEYHSIEKSAPSQVHDSTMNNNNNNMNMNMNNNPQPMMIPPQNYPVQPQMYYGMPPPYMVQGAPYGQPQYAQPIPVHQPQQPMVMPMPYYGVPAVGRPVGDTSDTGLGVVLGFCVGMWAYLALLIRTSSHRLMYGIHLGNGMASLFIGVLILAVALPLAANNDASCNNNNYTYNGRHHNDCGDAVAPLAIIGSVFIIISAVFMILARTKQRQINAMLAQIAHTSGGILPPNSSQIYF
eukprot:comp17211_c0_seq1/m.28659 comp17211_c0_seq1/g.28659  ORF comp17211_c0_seq1/g.28659 comp17211_c0_seq1/m.28659 type:complete len:240 (+) comp17211_c0_seq1:439-1158(+)